MHPCRSTHFCPCSVWGFPCCTRTLGRNSVCGGMIVCVQVHTLLPTPPRSARGCPCPVHPLCQSSGMEGVFVCRHTHFSSPHSAWDFPCPTHRTAGGLLYMGTSNRWENMAVTVSVETQVIAALLLLFQLKI